MGRTASGVRAINLKDDDIAVCMDIAVEDEDLLVISENGFGKRTPISEYKVQNRGGVGLITYKISEKTGKVIGATMCNELDELMLINSSGVAIRINVKDISITGRAAMGVTLMRTNEDEKVVAVAKISGSEEENTEEQIDILDDYNDENDILDKLVSRAKSDSEE